MAEDARITPSLAGRMPLAVTGEAAGLAEVLPHLAVEARNVAAQLQLGIHGRRRPGPGEEFWEFRAYMPGESVSLIDWRRSARDDRLYVREREWESASAHWLWFDLSPSMHYQSRFTQRSKRDRALVLGLALADLLVHAGERVGLAGLTPPLATRSIIMRLAEALLHAQAHPAGLDMASDLPPDMPIKRHDHLILIGDFIAPPEEIEARLARFAQRGIKGTLLLIRDPAEEDFPFEGELEFEGMEDTDRWRVGDAGEMAAQYRKRIADVTASLQMLALRQGFAFVRHTTSRPAAEALLSLAALIGGEWPNGGPEAGLRR